MAASTLPGLPHHVDWIPPPAGFLFPVSLRGHSLILGLGGIIEDESSQHL